MWCSRESLMSISLLSMPVAAPPAAARVLEFSLCFHWIRSSSAFTVVPQHCSATSVCALARCSLFYSPLPLPSSGTHTYTLSLTFLFFLSSSVSWSHSRVVSSSAFRSVSFRSEYFWVKRRVTEGAKGFCVPVCMCVCVCVCQVGGSCVLSHCTQARV